MGKWDLDTCGSWERGLGHRTFGLLRSSLVSRLFQHPPACEQGFCSVALKYLAITRVTNSVTTYIMVQSLPKDICVVRVVIKFPDFRTADVQSPCGITVITDLSTVSHSENSQFRMLYILPS